MSVPAAHDEWADVQTQIEALRAVVPDLADLPPLDRETAPRILSRVVEETEALRRRVLRDRILRASLQELMGALLRGRDPGSTLDMLAAYLQQVLEVGEIVILRRRAETGEWQGTHAGVGGRVERLGRITGLSAILAPVEGPTPRRPDPERPKNDPLRYAVALPLESPAGGDGTPQIIGFLGMNGALDDDADWTPEEIARRVTGMLETLDHREEIERADRFRRQLLEAMQDGVLAIDEEGMILEANAGALRALGRAEDDLRGSALTEHTFRAPALVRHLQATLGRKTLPSPREISVRIGGRAVPYNVAISSLDDDRGARRGIVVNLTDLTPLREMEEEIDRLDRLAALGRFAAGIAHEIRNPLAGIGTGVEYLSRSFPPEAPEQRDIRYVLAEVQRLNSIVADLLDYTQPRPLQRRDLSAIELVEHVRLGLQSYADGREVRLTIEGPSEARLFGDPGRLEQVLLNLVRNGIEASPAGGEVVLRWEEEPRFRFLVEDEGPGLSEEQCRRAFEPFFTTKGNGTGLGLYISHSIVEQHGGRLVLGNRERGGASISVELPQPEAERTRENALVHLDR